MEKHPQRVMVTGGAGFIGSCVVRQLLAGKGTQVLNVDALTYAGRLETLADLMDDSAHRFLRADIADSSAMSDAFEAFKPDAVIHLAAETHVDRSIDGVAPFLHTNVVGTVTLLNAALDFWRGLSSDAADRFRFLHVSTDEVFGSLGADGIFNEDSPHRPNSPYSASKASADHFVRAWHRTYGLPTMTSNCSNNYGPYQFPEKLIPVVILAALESRPIPVYGDGSNVRDWLFVEDHAKALSAILRDGAVGELYCIGGAAEVSNIDLVRMICDLMDELSGDGRNEPHRDLIEFVADRPGHDFRYAIDNAKIVDALSWAPGVTLKEGLRKTVAWYLENRGWWQPIANESRERKGLAPLSG